jgi:hypothetical protein
VANPEPKLAFRLRIGYCRHMVFKRPHNSSRPARFMGQTARALFSTLLLLGLSGDRRAR